MNREPASVRLRVSTRIVHAADGQTSGELRVYCPDQGRQVPLEACARCSRSRGVELDADGRGSFVVCAPRRGSAPPCGHDRIAAVMSPTVVCLRSDMTLLAAREILLERNIGAAPIVGEDRKVLGILSRSDLLGVRSPLDDPSLTVEQVMMPLAFALEDTASVPQAAGLMATEGIHRLLVVSRSGELVGILSALDVMRWLAERDGVLRARPAAPHGGEDGA